MKDLKAKLVFALLAALAIVAIVAIVALQMNADGDSASGRAGSAGTASTLAGQASDGEGPVVIRSRGGRGASFVGDGGVPVAQLNTPRERTTPTVSTSGGGVYLREQIGTDETDRSNGWRVGRRRRQVEMLETRAERLTAAVEQLRADGREDLALRQQSIVDRTRARVVTMQEELTELQASAQADGTLADAEQGYEDTPLTRTEARARVALPAPAP